MSELVFHTIVIDFPGFALGYVLGYVRHSKSHMEAIRGCVLLKMDGLGGLVALRNIRPGRVEGLCCSEIILFVLHCRKVGLILSRVIKQSNKTPANCLRALVSPITCYRPSFNPKQLLPPPEDDPIVGQRWTRA